MKYEEVYLQEHATLASLAAGLEAYFWFYCHERPHQALGNRTPAVVYGLPAQDDERPATITTTPKAQCLAGSLAQQNGDFTGTQSGDSP